MFHLFLLLPETLIPWLHVSFTPWGCTCTSISYFYLLYILREDSILGVSTVNQLLLDHIFVKYCWPQRGTIDLLLSSFLECACICKVPRTKYTCSQPIRDGLGYKGSTRGVAPSKTYESSLIRIGIETPPEVIPYLIGTPHTK